MTAPEESIHRRIREGGPITFADFMEMALYGPDGYYTRGEPVGGRGADYFTSPVAHPLFGALLALQLEQMWRLLGAPDDFAVVEPGAGDGRLAHDIVAFAPQLAPDFAAALAYTAVDRAPRSVGGASSSVGWCTGDDPGLGRMTGCVVSNELFDAFPVHRLKQVDGGLREAYVDLADGRLVELLAEPSTPRLAAHLESEGVALEEGWRAEVSLVATDWMEAMASRLTRGYVITVDYGDLAEDLYTERRRQGTLMSYYDHTPQEEPLQRVGRQDITAHVNFTALIEAGKRGGLQPVVLMTQDELLRNLGAGLFIEALAALHLPQPQYQANAMAMRALLRPEGLGGFRVLVQAKGAAAADLACLRGDEDYLDSLRRRLPELEPPLLGEGHVDLMAARFPHLAGG
jgi:SAM-dependent MidA family methyltransferase